MAEYTGDPKSHPSSEFVDGMSGSCLCGSITVDIKDKELFTKKRTILCHCANCRKVAGSALSANLVLDESQVEIKDRDGTRKVYQDKGNSGKAVFRHFCSTDGNPICSIAEAIPGKVILKMGMFPRIPDPVAESFGEHRHEWQGKHPGVTIYKIAPGGPLLEDE